MPFLFDLHWCYIRRQRLAMVMTGSTGGNSALADTGRNLQKVLLRLLCRLGIHDFKTIDITFGFGAGGSVETVECQRCGLKAIGRN